MKNIRFIPFSVTLLFALVTAFQCFGQKDRDQTDDRYKWDLTDIFPSDKDWNEASKVPLPNQQNICLKRWSSVPTSGKNPPDWVSMQVCILIWIPVI